jgi:imidazolonepropionase-like amidohydrolase
VAKLTRMLLVAASAMVVAPCISAESLAIVSVNVVDVATGQVRSGQTVLVANDRITQVGAASEVIVPAGTKPIAADGRYLLPGLWDMHVHFRNDPTKPDVSLADENSALLDLYLAHGVVGVREMGGDLADSVLQWRQEIEEGRRMGPRILTAARKIDEEKPFWPGSISVMTPEEGRQAVLQVKQMGADFVKVYFGLVEPAVLRAVIDEAHKQKLTVTGHAPRNLATDELVKMGMDGLEHAYCLFAAKQTQFETLVKEVEARRNTPLRMRLLDYLSRMMWMHDETAAAEVYGAMARRGTWLTPTLAVQVRLHTELGEKDFSSDPRKRFLFPAIWASWDPETGQRRPPSRDDLLFGKELVKRISDNVRAAHKAGVPMLAGTDSGVSNNYMFPGWSLHEELENLVKAGFTPLQALQTATLNPAKYRGRSDTEGTIEKGKIADLLLLRSNPLQSIGRTREIDAVIVRGRYYSRNDLDHLLENVEKRAAAGERRN